MAQATLSIDLAAICNNWRALDKLSAVETGACVKADAYGLGAPRVARALAQAGARSFFVALTEEGAALRQHLGDGIDIYVFSGHMKGDTDMIGDLGLIPLINSVDQMLRHVEALPGAPFGIQLDSGMNRLGMEPGEWAAVRDIALSQGPRLVMSHLACADEPNHAMNAMQHRAFSEMIDGVNARRSLAATGGVLLGAPYHFDMTRPGIGLYGGMPFADAQPVVKLDIPIIQTRDIDIGESVGYGNAFIAQRPSRIATIGSGYADGILRAMGPKAALFCNDTRVPVAGRISMDLIGVDITDASEGADTLELLGHHQSVDTLAEWSGTIGYEILTSLGARYKRRYVGV
ncbi:MAG: alanine racemase [Marinovum sp.]|nr:alanine racemase [Marinovum sp.]